MSISGVMAACSAVGFLLLLAGQKKLKVKTPTEMRELAEELDGGDPVRRMGPFKDDRPDPEASLRFAFLNAGKKSVTIDLDDAASREFIGVCVDTCHMAVEFEPAGTVFARLTDAGIAIPKVQVSSALDASSDAARQALSAFADDTYLHQVLGSRDGALERKVTAQPPRRNHPVQDVASGGAGGKSVQRADSHN